MVIMTMPSVASERLSPERKGNMIYAIINLVSRASQRAFVVFFSVCLVRVFLTAVDRRVGSRGGRKDGKAGKGEPSTKSYSPTLLVKTPLIGAYPVEDGKGGGYSWKGVWEKLLIQFVLGVAVLFAIHVFLYILAVSPSVSPSLA